MASCSALLVVVLVAGLTSARPHWQGHDHSDWNLRRRHDQPYGGDQHAREEDHHGQWRPYNPGQHEQHSQWPQWKHGQHEHHSQWPQWKHNQHEQHGQWPQWKHGQHEHHSQWPQWKHGQHEQHGQWPQWNHGQHEYHGQWPNWKYGQHEHHGQWPHGNHSQHNHQGQWPHWNRGQWPYGQHSQTWHNTHPDVKNPFVVPIPPVVYPSVVSTTPQYDKDPDVDTTIGRLVQSTTENPKVNTNPDIDLEKWLKLLDEIEKNETITTLDYEATQETNTEQGGLETTTQNVVPDAGQSTTGNSNHPDVDTNTTDQTLDTCLEAVTDETSAIIHSFNTNETGELLPVEGNHSTDPKNIHGKFILENGFWVWTPGFPAHNAADTVEKDHNVEPVKNSNVGCLKTTDGWGDYVFNNGGTKSDEEPSTDQNINTNKEVNPKQEVEVFKTNQEGIDSNQEYAVTYDFNTNLETNSDVGSLKTDEDWMDYVFINGGSKPEDESSAEQNFSTTQENDEDQEYANVQDFSRYQRIDTKEINEGLITEPRHQKIVVVQSKP